MKVGAGGIPAFANHSDHRAPLDPFALFHLDLLEMGVTGLVSTTVLNDNEAAEFPRPAGKAHTAVSGGADLCALGRRQVKSLVA